MGNQQVKSDFDIGWMSGIIDGEGWLILNEQLLPSGNYRYVPVVGVNCTSKAMTDKIQSICTEWGVGTWVSLRKFENHWKDQYVINIRGFQRVKNLLDVIGDRLVVKPKQSKLLMEYIDHRLSIPKQKPCGDVEKTFYENLKVLNKKGKTSTTK